MSTAFSRRLKEVRYSRCFASDELSHVNDATAGAGIDKPTPRVAGAGSWRQAGSIEVKMPGMLGALSRYLNRGRNLEGLWDISGAGTPRRAKQISQARDGDDDDDDKPFLLRRATGASRAWSRRLDGNSSPPPCTPAVDFRRAADARVERGEGEMGGGIWTEARKRELGSDGAQQEAACEGVTWGKTRQADDSGRRSH